MHGHIGDRLVLRGTHVGDPGRIGVIMELRHDDGTPPYVVRWLDNDREGLVFPGTDACIEEPPSEHSPPDGRR